MASWLLVYAMQSMLDTVGERQNLNRVARFKKNLAYPVVTTYETVVCCKHFQGFLMTTQGPAPG